MLGHGCLFVPRRLISLNGVPSSAAIARCFDECGQARQQEVHLRADRPMRILSSKMFVLLRVLDSPADGARITPHAGSSDSFAGGTI